MVLLLMAESFSLSTVVNQLGGQVGLLVKRNLVSTETSQCHLIGCALSVVVSILQGVHPAFSAMSHELMMHQQQICLYQIHHPQERKDLRQAQLMFWLFVDWMKMRYEEMLRYEFSKHAPIKDLRLVRDKFTHVSRGFAFVHFHSVEDATKALDATNGTTLEKNGQILRVAYAKSILGPGSSGSSQSSSLAAAAIEAAAFAQQYDAVGWAPKEYNPDEKQSVEHAGGEITVQKDGSNAQSAFVWDEASGYYYDAASGFYFDGNTGLYYDGNSGVWYTYDQQTQQYIPYTENNDNKASGKQSENSKSSDGSSNRKVVISAPAATITSSVEKAASLHDAVQAAATAALAAEKKEKEKAKEIKLASKSSILANKKKMNNVLTMWKQRSHEGQATRVALDDSHPSVPADDKLFSAGQSTKSKFKSDSTTTKDNTMFSSGVAATSTAQTTGLESPVKPRPASNSSGGTLMGVIRGSGRGVCEV
ncbi:LOW QUALITY PROTEIN: hypothetical protein NC653_010968 [Populus alba x Populus x berolinensis]|uniref:RRM domain-containing protein n=1 Tax=Populus alba x Populus x berolinensis TaxID=444605 RepID=A0AAD6R0X5_9ROSI|nr:LOW QUALITY PROTEIN: hypothetical protein NC653_010968 [Populus alba x Populus x berolinensis]